MSPSTGSDEGLPDWVLAFGPFFVIGALIAGAFTALSVLEFDWLAVSGTLNVLIALTVIGFIAGILPVIVGMLWFPYVRQLEPHWIHAVLAFSAGLLAFIAFEMGGEAIEHALEAPSSTVGLGVVVVAVVGTVGLMESVSRWRQRKTATAMSDGLRVAYFVAIGLGIHSIGEGLAIGSAFVLGDTGLVVLLTLGFIMHNVTEGPAVISAVARDRDSPPLRHFAMLGLLAGGGVIIGGWVGSFADSALVAALFFAIAFGAILQVLWEMRGLILKDAETLVRTRTIAAFIVGVVLMFFLEEIVVSAWLLG